MSDSAQDHDAPLRQLVATLHQGTTLRERVIKLRWKRRRPAKVADAAVSSEQQTTTNNESEVGGE